MKVMTVMIATLQMITTSWAQGGDTKRREEIATDANSKRQQDGGASA
jgi:hypothetical protein